MKITAITDLHADAGWRTYSFLKVETDAGITGWSEYTEAVGNQGTSAAIRRMGGIIEGRDPMDLEAIMAWLYTQTVPVPSGITAHARAAIANALLDIKGKALGVPVYQLFGGKLRDRIPLYWTHFAGQRIRSHKECGFDELTSYEALTDLAAGARAEGWLGMKMNLFTHDGSRFHPFSPGHGVSAGYPELNPRPNIARAAARQVEAMRKGAGDNMAIYLDLNYNFKLDGYLEILRALAPLGLAWAELDTVDPETLAYLRQHTSVPLASGESLYGRAEYKPYLQRYAMDVAVVDVIWNGFFESYKIAAMAEPFQLNTAPHNFYGHLADHISAHYAATVPNLRVMEYEAEDIPWRHEFFTHAPQIENGHMLVPDRPGWGTDIVEDAVRARPAKPAS
jgi:L-alanine-DL-glutamate epimerase-like enolase superfamily enzyme